MSRHECLGCDPDREAAALLQRPVVGRPVADLVAHPRDPVAAWLISLAGHQASRERGRRPILPATALPKPGQLDLCTRVAIKRFVAGANANPRPFRWTKDPDKIIAAVRRGHQALDSLH